jgi:hypothetical protein
LPRRLAGALITDAETQRHEPPRRLAPDQEAGEAAGVRRSSPLPHEGRERYVDAVQHRRVFAPHALGLGSFET